MEGGAPTRHRPLPLRLLELAPENARSTPAGAAADAELKASIAAHGILVNFVVLPAAAGRFAVVAGGRRLAMLKALAAEGVLDADHPVPCRIQPDAEDAHELSLAENVARAACTPRTRRSRSARSPTRARPRRASPRGSGCPSTPSRSACGSGTRPRVPRCLPRRGAHAMSPCCRHLDTLAVATTREADPDAIARCLRFACRQAKAEGMDPAADPVVRLMTAWLARVVNGTPLAADYADLVRACRARADTARWRPAP